MITLTSPSKGISTDNSILEHDPAFARESVNGRFSSASNNFTWIANNLHILKATYTNSEILAAFSYENYTIILILDETANHFIITQYDQSNNSFTELFSRDNDLGIDTTHKIESCTFWRNSTRTKFRIYFTNGYSEPISIDLLDPSNYLYPASEFMFSVKKKLLLLDLSVVTTGGNLICGNNYYAAQAYNDNGAVMDWVFLHTPVMIPNIIPSVYTAEEYQNIEGANVNGKSNAKVILWIKNYSDYDGWKVRVACFLALDELTLDVGTIFYEGAMQQYIDHTSNISLRTVLFNDINQASLTIKKIGVMASNGEINTIGNIDIDEMLPGSTTDNVKFLDRPTVTLKLNSEQFTGAENKGLVIDNATNSVIRRFPTAGQQKQAQTSEQFTGNDLVRLNYKKASVSTPNTNVWNYNYDIFSPGFYDYTNPNIAFRKKIYRIGEAVRLALVPYTLYGKQLRPIWINDLAEHSFANAPTSLASYKPIWESGLIQREYKGSFFIDSGNPEVVKLEPNCIEIRNLELKEFVNAVNNDPLIAGFSIVQAEPRKKRVITEGFLTRVINSVEYTNNPVVPFVRYLETGDINLTVRHLKGDGWVLLYSPDVFFGRKTINTGDKVVITGKLNSKSNISTEEHYLQSYLNLQKHYYGVGSDLWVEGEVEKVVTLPFYPTTNSVYVEGLGTVSNLSVADASSGESLAAGNKNALLIKLRSGSEAYNLFASNTIADAVSLDYYTVRIENNIHGFDNNPSDADLAATVYKNIGHYQAVDSDFFAAIKNGASYKCDVCVYGGQYYGGIFEAMRVIPNLNDNGWRANTIYLPVVTDFNIRMRTGARHSKNRIVGNDGGSNFENNDGIGVVEGRGQWEDYLYSTSYLNKSNGKEFLPIPNNFEIINKIVDAVFWSQKQALQGNDDYFRIFPASQYKLCDNGGKEISGLVFDHDKLIVFQRKAIGFLPYNERLLASMTDSSSLVVSYGTIFPQYKNISKSKGIASNAMQCLTDNGLFFYCDIDNSLNVIDEPIQDIGIKLGIESLIKNEFSIVRRLVHNKYNSLLLLQFDRKVLDISLSKMIANGYSYYSNLTAVKMIPFGSSVAIVDRDGGGNSLIYKEDFNGQVSLVQEYKLTVVIGADKKEMFNKIFDNLIIHTADNLNPTTIKFTAGLRNATESLLNNPNVLLNGSIIYMSIPLIPITNTAGILNTDRVSNQSVCVIELSSANRFAINKVICNFRYSK